MQVAEIPVEEKIYITTGLEAADLYGGLDE